MKGSAPADLAARRALAAQAIRRRLVAHIAAGGTTDLASAPLEHRADRYTDLERAALEVSELFLKRPLVAGLSREILHAGDRIAFEAVGRSVIVVRQANGELRAFRNMCAHRGAKLVRPNGHGCDRARQITCPFHAWSYDLDGTLRSVPGAQGFEGLDWRSRHLQPVPVVEWHGLVFVRLEGAAPIDCAQHLGEFSPVLEQLELAEFTPVQSSALQAGTNWKYALDTYGEGYHFGVLHGGTIGATHFTNVAAFDAFGAHWRLNFAEKALAGLVGKPPTLWPEASYDGIHFLFPNTIMVVGGPAAGQSFVRMFRIFPGATPAAMSCQFSVYARGLSQAQFRGLSAGVVDSESEVTREDYRVAVEAYGNLSHAAPGYRLVFGRNEPAVQAFHRAIAAAIGAPL